MRKLFFLSLVMFLFSCEENKKKDQFSLTGKTDELPDGTELILETISSREALDTAIVEDGSFKFEVILKQSPINVVMHTEDFKSYRMMWLENKAMTYDGVGKKFKDGIVQGAETEALSQKLFNGIDTLSRAEQQEREIQFVRDHPESIVSANILSIYATTWGKSLVTELFENFPKENQSNQYSEKIARFLDLNKQPQIGEKYVDFTMKDQNGESKSLSDYAGQLVLLEFWASWCGPCRSENPNLVKTYEKYKPHGFEVFAVSLDQEKEHWLDAISSDGLNWPQVSELNGSDNKASLIYGVNGIPDNFLLNAEGVIVGRNLRGDALDRTLAELIKAI